MKTDEDKGIVSKLNEPSSVMSQQEVKIFTAECNYLSQFILEKQEIKTVSFNLQHYWLCQLIAS